MAVVRDLGRLVLALETGSNVDVSKLDPRALALGSGLALDVNRPLALACYRRVGAYVVAMATGATPTVTLIQGLSPDRDPEPDDGPGALHSGHLASIGVQR